MNDLISRGKLFDRLAVIPAPPEANEYKAEVYKAVNGAEPVPGCGGCKHYTVEGICVYWSRYGFQPEDYCSRWEGKMRDLTEMNKLEEHLKEKGFNYDRRDYETGENLSGKPMDWHQIRVYKDDVQIWDVVCHYGSYGSERGLLEGAGEIFSGDVEGHLTADDVIRKIEGR